jgi:hypothetical protein
MNMPYSNTITIGSQAWIDHWINFHWRVACKNSDHAEKYPAQAEHFIDIAMYHLFMVHMWETAEPWN